MPLISNKYNYISIPKETIDNKRLYTTPTGEKLPSVTTILSKTESKEKHAILEAWRNRVGRQKAAEITMQAASRGTRMHKYLERYILEGALPEPGSNPYSQESHKMAKEIITHGFTGIEEVWGVEVNLYYPGLYAGTTDCCGIHFGKEAILDYKQSNRVKIREHIDDYFIQLASYALCHNNLYGTNIRKGVILMCVKPEEIKPGVFGSPQYLEFIVEGAEFDKYATIWWNRVEQYYLA